MKSAKYTIQEKLGNIVQEIAGEEVEIKLDTPQDISHGDYSSNISLQLSKKLGKNPREVAEQIKSEYEKLEDTNVKNIEIAGPGFLNFFLSEEYLFKNLETIKEMKDEYGNSDRLAGKKVMVEFTDPNPLKEFHIGHLYSNTVGESISRLLEFQGADLWRVNYQGDVGLHIAKAIFGILSLWKLPIDDFTVEGNTHFESLVSEFENKQISEKAKFLGEAYAFGAREYENDEVNKNKINRLNKRIYEKDPDIYPFYEKARQWSLDYFETIYKRLGTKFKRYYFESEAGPIGIEIIKKHIGDIFEEEGGAVIFPKEKSGLHTRVFVNSLGLPTYEAKELGLAPTKHKDFPYDTSIVITGNEINEYFRVLLKALSFINPELSEKTKHISHGMVRLPSGKMSSRTGQVLTGEWLLDEVKKKLFESFPDMDSVVGEKLTVGAVKYALLKSSVGQDLTFSLEESINLHGNSGPYLQYAYARTQNVLEKSEPGNVSNNYEPNSEEQVLIRMLIHFSEIVERASLEYSPSVVCTYLFELAQSFSVFYEKHRISDAENEDAKNFRLLLTVGVGHVLKNGLCLLGISAPVKI